MSPPRIHTETLSSGLAFEMILVEGGSFLMGSDGEDARDSEQPIHRVSVPSFYLGTYLCTQALWEAVMNENPSDFKGSKRPAENISWDDIQTFLKKLNVQKSQSYRLPTEAEWEFAARGGIYHEGYLYAGSDKLKEVGWYDENAGDETRDVGLLLPNELGLYDMSGNVDEWCEDDWHDDYQSAPEDDSVWIDGEDSEASQETHRQSIGRLIETPKKIHRGSTRVLRGGFWNGDARFCRVSDRNFDGPGGRFIGIGFRLALSPQSAGLHPATP